MVLMQFGGALTRRVVPGHWLGPSTLCHTLEALCRRRAPAGLRVRVVASAGGGAPVLATSECVSLQFQVHVQV